MATVLIVDDDMALRKIIAHFLREEGMLVLECKNPFDALKVLESTVPHVVMLDVMMPGMDGFTLCRKIKEQRHLANVPVIICTARSRKEDLMMAIRAGADDYLLKPFTRDTLLKKVQRMLLPPERRVTQPIPSVERRSSQRTPVNWVVSWGPNVSGPLETIYKNRVVNISQKGFAFEFERCQICTGYEVSTVHPMCLLAPFAKRFEEAKRIDFILSISREVVIEVKGRIAHIFQPPDWPKTEIVGVAFVDMPQATEEMIRRHAG